MRRPTLLDLLAGLEANEGAASDALLALLMTTRNEMTARLLALPDGMAEVEVIVHMRVAVDRALRRLRGGMERTMATSSAEAVQLGIDLADHSLPVTLVGTFGLNDFNLVEVARSNVDLITSMTSELRGNILRQIQLGYLGGQTPQEVADRIGGTGIVAVGPFPTAANRAEAIARTELGRISNTATYERGVDAATRIPGLRKRWRATGDGRTRPAHAAANGQTVAMDADFIVGGEHCSHPHDLRLSAGNSIRCRCCIILEVPDDD